jgi:hypothetical protein
MAESDAGRGSSISEGEKGMTVGRDWGGTGDVADMPDAEG